ncbi:MAG: TIM-barrel domain-containing protein [Bacteroidota bacterium]
MRTFITLLSIVVLACNTYAQTRTYQSHNEENGKLSVVTSDGTYIFTPYSNNIIETMFVPIGETIDSKSHAVVQLYDQSIGNYSYEGNDISFHTGGMGVTITTEPFNIRYTYKGKELLFEGKGYEDRDTLKTIGLSITKDEVLYGAGARALGMNRRGKRLPLYNRAHYGYETYSEQMNFCMPIVMSSNKYLVHFDNAPIGFLDLDSGENNTITYETISGRMVYQVVAGDDWLQILDAYTDLTGKQPMVPRWALGNFASRFGYHTQRQTERTVDMFVAQGFPLDAIVLDLYWFGKELKGTMGNLEVYKDSFPDFQGMVSRFKQEGVNTVTITEPYILTSSKRWNEAVEKNILAKDSVGNDATYEFYFGNTGIIDIFKPEGEQWFWERYKYLAELGVAGVWGDLGEPEVLPSWVEFSAGSADEIHNIYGHNWARLVFEGYELEYPDIRPFILMRAGYSGSQRYGMIPWSGDVSRGWGGLQSQPEIALQMGMQGMAYMHSDLGGFAGANLDDELYARWLQYGVFNPIFRPHAQEDVPSEPIFRRQKPKALAKKAIELRYSLLPYNYNLVFENSISGAPLMRPLFFEEPDNPELLDYSETYLWGKDFLVAPILEAGKTSQDVYFPEGSYWYDFYSTDILEGGQIKNVATVEEHIPTYVRAGAFIPLSRKISTTDSNNDDRFTLHYFHHESVENSKREFYMDSGVRLAYEKGEYEVLDFSSEFNGKWLEINCAAEQGSNYEATIKKIDVVVHNMPEFPDKMLVNKQDLMARRSTKDKTLIFTLNWDTQKDLQIRLKLNKTK